MPEGDTVYRTCQRLDQALAGRVLLAAELRWPGLSTADLAGARVLAVVPHGKHLLLRLDSGWTLHSHLRMDGSWVIEHTAPVAAPGRGGPTGRRSAATRPDARAVLITDEWTAVGLALGMLDLVRTTAEDSLVGHLGPDLLAEDVDTARAVANLVAGPAVIGAALLDQTLLAGIGTFWAAEVLFARRVHPWTPAAELPAAELTALVGLARRMMLASLRHPIQTSTGEVRRDRTSMVHARSGRHCRRCGGIVRVAPIGPPGRERPMFYCPGCQGGLAPGDDGRPIAPLGAHGR